MIHFANVSKTILEHLHHQIIIKSIETKTKDKYKNKINRFLEMIQYRIQIICFIFKLILISQQNIQGVV